MRMFLRAAVAVGAVGFLQTLSFAGTLMVAGSGIFSAGAPSTTYSAPLTAWSFSFNVPDVPAISNADDIGFDVPVSNFTYQVGATTLTPTPDRMRFFNGGIGGLFNIDISATSFFNDNPVIGFEFSETTNGQAFSAAVMTPVILNPTILTGSYPTTSASFFSNSAQVDSFSGVTINITEIKQDAPATPEPATIAMAAAAFGIFAWMRRRQSVR